MPAKKGVKKTKPKTKSVKKVEKKEKVTKSAVTEIVCIIDRSGSMDSIKMDAIGGFNNFLADQKKEKGKAIMTIALFDNEYILMCSGKPLGDVEPFNENTYVPRGSTALLDAVGRTINETNQRNPEKAIIVVLTDGHENSSHEFTKQAIKKMIADCEAKGWVVVYLSADANAFEDGRTVGVGINNIMSFSADQRGANIGTMSASYATSDYRQKGARGMSSMAQYSCRASNQYDATHGQKSHSNGFFSSSGSTTKKKHFF
jgi:hypothetical protein